MKKLMIILLIGMLTLGLSGVAFATGEQAIGAEIGGTVSLTVPGAVSAWSMTYTAGATTTQDNTRAEDSTTTNSGSSADTDTVIVDANCPYQLKVKVDSAAYPDTADVYMSNSTTSEDLTIALKLAYSDGRGAVTSYDLSQMAFNTAADPANPDTAITTGDQVFFDEPLVPDDGIDYIGIALNQQLVITDPAYTSTGTQVTYQIKLVWSVATVLE